MSKTKPKPIESLADLSPDPKNANRGTQRGRGLLEKSLRRYGAGRSILADKHGVIVAGNKTLETAADIGLPVRVIQTDGKELVVVQRTDLDLAHDKAARELAYADNRVAQVDLDFDPVQMAADAAAGVELGEFWTKDELAEIIGNMDGGAGDGDEDELPSAPSRVQAGETWALGRHRIACIDSLDRDAVLALLAGAKTAFVWADPPYGVNAVANSPRLRELGYTQYANDSDTGTARASVQMCREFGGVQVWWGANYYANELEPSSCWIVWDKDHHGMDFADAELAWVQADKPVRCFRHAWSGADRDSEKGEKRSHPTQKPIALAEWAFDKYGGPDDVIFDPFLGSGISVLAAEKMGDGRTVYGCELSAAYCDVTIARWEALTGQTATLA